MDSSIQKIYEQNQNSKSIVIIGAGPCGILLTRYLKDKNVNIICIESKEDIGGQWHQDKYTEFDHPNLQKNSFYQDYRVLHSSLYENLLSNLPKFLMTYKGFPVKEEYNEFMTSQQFYQYLQDYCKFHDLKKYILFNTFVSSIRLTKNITESDLLKIGLKKKFLIKIQQSDDFTKDQRYIQADSVVVANGHYTDPYIPKIENDEIYKENKLHSHYLREKVMDEYKGKHLVIIGSSVSAMDITNTLFKIRNRDLHPKRISIIGSGKSIGKWKQATSYSNEIEANKLVLFSSRVKKYDSERSLTLNSGEKVDDIDNVLFATGYKYTYPFIEKNNNIDQLLDRSYDKKSCFGPLYRRIFCIREPQLAFIGLQQNNQTVQSTFERQAICIARYLSGEVQLPSQSIMQEEYEKDIKEADDGNIYFKVSFSIGLNEFTYAKQLQEIAMIPMDEEFNKFVKQIQIPLLEKIYSKADYPILRCQKVSDKLPPQYYPKENLF